MFEFIMCFLRSDKLSFLKLLIMPFPLRITNLKGNGNKASVVRYFL